MSAPELTAEEQAWEDGGRKLDDNPIVSAFVATMLDVLVGNVPEEDGLTSAVDVVRRWVWYLAEGEQDVSWYEPILVQANEFMRATALSHGVKYTPGLTAPRKYPALRALLEESNSYPRNVGTMQETTGFDLTRDRLIEILSQCSPRVAIGAVPDHYDPSGDGTSFRITVYATFSRSELDMPFRKG